jgi:hypothetical protein
MQAKGGMGRPTTCKTEDAKMRETLILLVCALSGCGSLFNQHAQMMDAMRGVMSDTASRLGQSGTGQIAAGGQVINPGLRVCGGMEYYATAQYTGVSGQVQASMMGGLDRPVPPEVQARADAIWRNTSMSASERLRMTQELLGEWMRQSSPTTTAIAKDGDHAK